MEFFNDIVCINLDISKDRREHSEFYFKKLNITARFFTAKKHPNGGMYGCFDSHIQILLEAYKKNLDNILVFEDDFLPTSSYSFDKMLIAINFMKNNKDWDIFHLGYSVIKDKFNGGVSTIFSGIHYNDDIIQFNPMLTQALCYNKRAIKTIIENYNDYIGAIHYDAFISNYLNFKNYCIVPMLFDQNFYFQHNNVSQDMIETILRACFPLIGYSKINYRISYLEYFSNRYYFYLKLIMILIITYSYNEFI